MQLDADRSLRGNFDDRARVLQKAAGIFLEDVAGASIELSDEFGDDRRFDEGLLVDDDRKAVGDRRLYREDDDVGLEARRDRHGTSREAEDVADADVLLLDAR